MLMQGYDAAGGHRGPQKRDQTWLSTEGGEEEPGERSR